MSLSTYKKKRSFTSTPEPVGGAPSEAVLRFVVQKHAATRLHYDFRLEMAGVLKSWAVPKGPSLNPADKRLAMMVEDHPFDYRTFEGTIPKGNYGAGTVIVWDEGDYEPLEPSGNKKTDEKALLRQLKSGSLKIRLKGSKLKGEFALVRIKHAEDNSWLLIKHRDKYAKETDITQKDRSVISKKTLEQMARMNAAGKAEEPAPAARKTPGKTVKKAATTSKKTTPQKRVETTAATKRTTPGKQAKTSASAPSPAGRKAPFPQHITPMLATLIDHPFEQPGWLFEIKWDGYRALALSNKGSVELVSRNSKSFNEKFYPVHEAVKAWGVNAVVDGEICVLNGKGIAHFGSLQNWRSEADGELIYYVFDLLWLDGRDLMGLPLTERREALRSILPEDPTIRYSEAFETTAAEFLAAAQRLGMEGIMAKKADSAYIPGDRSHHWLKIKAGRRHEVVIGGFTNNEGSPKLFSSLLVGVYKGKKLVYTGKIGTGFNDKMQREMMKLFKPLASKTCPFKGEPDVNKPSRFRPDPPHATVTWLRPKLVCEVSYTEITDDGVMRHPSFEGMRTDKPAFSVTAEVAQEAEEVLQQEEAATAKRLLKPSARKKRKAQR